MSSTPLCPRATATVAIEVECANITILDAQETLLPIVRPNFIVLYCFVTPPHWYLLPSCSPPQPGKSQARLSQSDPFSTNRSHSCNNRRLSDSLPPLCSPSSPPMYSVSCKWLLQADDVGGRGGGAVTDAVFVHLHIHSLFAHRVRRPSLPPTRKGQVGASRERFISERPGPPNT